MVVDQTTYTAYAMTYPEGPLYWRVQAVDGPDNSLTWSSPRSFTKRSPQVTLTVADQQRTDYRDRAAALGAAGLRRELRRGGLQERGHDRPGRRTSCSPATASRSRSPRPCRFPSPAQSYTWRVRPRDAANRPGQWTDLADASARFRVVGLRPPAHLARGRLETAGNDLAVHLDRRQRCDRLPVGARCVGGGS